MHYLKTKLTLLFTLIFGLSGLNAQQTVDASGGNASGAGGSVSYSVGQINYTTNTGVNGIVTQGVQHPYEIIIVGVDINPLINLEFTVFPNPTFSNLTLKTTTYPIDNITYKLFDINGKQLNEEKISSTETLICIQQFPVGVYFIKVVENNIEIKTFKVIKK